MSDLEQPEGAAPPEQSVPDYGGASPEEIQNALNMARGLSNLDTRHDVLGKLVRPDVDAQFLRSQFAPAEEEPEADFDPFAEVYGEQPPNLLGYDQQTGQPIYGNQPQFQEPAFDPRSLAPVFDQFGEHTRQQAVQEALQIFEQRQMEQAREQGISQGVSAAVQTHGLSDFGKGIVEAMTRQAVAQNPNKAPGDIANEMAKAYLDDSAQRFVANGGVPPVQGAAPPGGPIPGDAAPKTFKDALEQSYQGLNPSM